MASTELRTRNTGLLLAGGAAIVSGISVFINGYGVRAWAEISDPTTYTTLKNAAAALTLIVLALLVGRRDQSKGFDPAEAKRHWRGLSLIAVVGGSVPFVLFFEGLAQATSTDAAFIHKTLVIWVTILAVSFLHERVGWLQVAAIALLVVGQVALAGGVDGLDAGSGEWMILVATLLWAIETVIAKRLLSEVSPLTLGVSRMAGGAVLLIIFAIWRGAFAGIVGLTAEHLLWIALTGLTLSAYVWTWFAALSRAQAVDVTAVLVGGAVITALLDAGLRGLDLPSPVGLVLVTAGVLLVLATFRRPVAAHG